MHFFTDPAPFTHRARLYGFPCYFKSDGPDGCDLAGTNVVWDWCIEHVAPLLHQLNEFVRLAALGPLDYEPSPWPIELRGELRKK